MDRKRLSPWLRKKVNAGEFGLRWIDKEMQCFSIPWRHKSNRAWNKDNCQIFKEWAKFTNKHQEGQPEDWPGWKQRLRSALNKLCDFEEMHDMHNLDDPDNPYKVYQFVAAEKLKKDADSSSSAGSSPYSQPSPGCSQASPHFDALSPLYFGVDSNSQNNNACCWGSNPPNIPTTVEHSEENVLPCDSQVCLNIPVTSMYNEDIGPTQHEIISSSLLSQQITDSGETNMDIPSLPSDLLSIDSNNLVSGAKMPSDEFLLYRSDPADIQFPNPTQEPKIRYRIYFLDEVLQEGTLGDNEGAHLYFGHLPQTNLPDLPETVFGPKGLKKIKFPDVTNLKKSINSEMTRHIQDILMKMDRGFLLQYHNGDIYVQRLCRTRIFAYNPQIGNTLLNRASKRPQKLFDFSAFKDCLNRPQNEDAIPPPETFLTFGQELKNWDASFKKLCVHVELSHIEAWELRDSFLPPSSKSSILYSDLDSEDLMLASLRNLSLNNES